MAKHKALLGVELEVLAKKFDRFGWERDRGSAAHDRLMADWMNALCDYPLDEVQAACAAAVIANPNRMPNEGHVKAQVIAARAMLVPASRPVEPSRPPKDPNRKSAAEIMAEVGLKPRTFGGAE